MSALQNGPTLPQTWPVANVSTTLELGKVWSEGYRKIASTMGELGKVRFEHLAAGWKELAGARSPTAAWEMQARLAKEIIDETISNAKKITDVSSELASVTKTYLESHTRPVLNPAE